METLLGLLGVAGSLIGCAVYVGSKFGTMETEISLIRTNHLEHIYDRLGSIEEYLRGNTWHYQDSAPPQNRK